MTRRTFFVRTAASRGLALSPTSTIPAGNSENEEEELFPTQPNTGSQTTSCYDATGGQNWTITVHLSKHNEVSALALRNNLGLSDAMWLPEDIDTLDSELQTARDRIGAVGSDSRSLVTHWSRRSSRSTKECPTGQLLRFINGKADCEYVFDVFGYRPFSALNTPINSF